MFFTIEGLAVLVLCVLLAGVLLGVRVSRNH